jgi:ribonuclease BN (tRNA processing enzyme)
VKLLFLGASAAFCLGENHFQSNMLIESDSGQKLLIDCGNDVRRSLHAQGYQHSDINAVYISHLHCDHTGGLEWLGFTKRFFDFQKPALYISDDLTNLLWDTVLSGGMSSLESEQASLSTYFDIQKIQNNSFVWEEYKFELIKTIHYISNNVIMPSYGLFISNDSHKIFLSTDTRFSPDSLQTIYNKSDLILQDCETSELSSGQHARFQELKTLEPETKKKMWLYDYNDGELPDAKREGFQGFIVPGQSFIF